MDEHQRLLKAIYHTRCEQLQMAWLNPATRMFIGDCCAYAAACRMFPYFDREMKEDDVFSGAYDISEKVIEKVIEHIYSVWRDDSYSHDIEYYVLERHFSELGRGELIKILRYVYLSDRFSDAFFDRLLSDAPLEAKGINKPLEPKDLVVCK